MSNSNNNNSKFYKTNCIKISNSDDIKDYFTFDSENDLLGEGSFGSVFKGVKNEENGEFLKNIPSGVEVAIKKIDKDSFDKNEISILDKVKNLDNVVKYYGCLYDDFYIYIIMEYIKGLDFFEYIRKNPDNKKRVYNNILSICIKLAIAIDDLHKLGIIHNDIKIENIMVIENDSKDLNNNLDIKLFDYGFACELSNIDKCFLSDGTIKRSDGFINTVTTYTSNTINKYTEAEKKNIFKRKDWWAYIITIFDMLFSNLPKDEEKKTGVLLQNKLNKLNYFKEQYPPNIKIETLLLTLIKRDNFFSKTSTQIKNEIFTILEIPQSTKNNKNNGSSKNGSSKNSSKKNVSSKNGSKKLNLKNTKTCKKKSGWFSCFSKRRGSSISSNV